MFEANILKVCERDRGVMLTLFLQPELEYFQGHFPERPVLPGVVQTHWAIHYGKRYLNLPVRIKKLEVIKFKHIIKPGMEIELDLELKANGKLSFSYRCDADVMSSGRVVYPEQELA